MSFCVYNPHHTQLHFTAFICICSLNAHIIPLVLNHTFITDVVYKFIVKSEIYSTFCMCRSTTLFIFFRSARLGLFVLSKDVVGGMLYNTCCFDVLLVGFIE
jgi:hypothetical protein